MARFAQIILLLCIFAAPAATSPHRRGHRRHCRIFHRLPFFRRFPVNSPCILGRRFECEAGLKCWGFSRSDVRCTRMAQKGAVCDWQRTGVHCQKGVKCIGSFWGGAPPPPPPPPPVLLPLNARCVLTEECEAGLKCWGFSSADLRCTQRAPIGGACNWNATGVHCETGVECVSGFVARRSTRSRAPLATCARRARAARWVFSALREASPSRIGALSCDLSGRAGITPQVSVASRQMSETTASVAKPSPRLG